VRELGNGGGNLEPLVEDDLLSLESNVLGPFDESGQVSLGWDVTTDSERLGGLLEEGVLGGLGGLLGAVWGRSWLGFSFGGFGLEGSLRRQVSH